MLYSINFVKKQKTKPVNNPHDFYTPIHFKAFIYKFTIKYFNPEFISKASIFIFCIFTLNENIVYAEQLKSAISIQKKSIHSSQLSQNKINDLDDKTQELATEYRSILRKINSQKIYNAQLEKVIGSQKAEIVSLNQQLKDIETTQAEIIPLILKMLDTLDSFIQLDIPFLVTERTNRVQSLRKLMDRADISVSEKYRRVIEAYQIETEYGRTIEAYEGSLPVSETNRTVELLRIGRLALFYLSLDGNDAGFWDKKDKKWVSLDSSYRRSISDGIRIARKQAAPDLLSLPVNFTDQL